MYCEPPYQKPKPQQDGLLVCDNKYCEAQWQPGNWYRGYSEGTTGNFIPHHKVKGNCCPMCGTPQKGSTDE